MKSIFTALFIAITSLCFSQNIEYKIGMYILFV